jgi:hypothetical protein
MKSCILLIGKTKGAQLLDKINQETEDCTVFQTESLKAAYLSYLEMLIQYQTIAADWSTLFFFPRD